MKKLYEGKLFDVGTGPFARHHSVVVRRSVESCVGL